MNQGKERSSIQVIARAANILRLLEKEASGLSIKQLSTKSELPRSTVQRIIAALEEEHLVISTGASGKVTLGPAIVRMASNTNFKFARFVRPHLEWLAEQTGETVDLSILSRDQMIFVDQIDADHRLKAVSAVGQGFPAFSSANGKAALSLLDDQEIRALLEGQLFRETASTIVSIDDLLTEIAQIRAKQIAIDNEEHTEGISALGTAFFDPLGRIFAVSVPVPTIRFIRSKQQIEDMLYQFRDSLMGSLEGPTASPDIADTPAELPRATGI